MAEEYGKEQDFRATIYKFIDALMEELKIPEKERNRISDEIQNAEYEKGGEAT